MKRAILFLAAMTIAGITACQPASNSVPRSQPAPTVSTIPPQVPSNVLSLLLVKKDNLTQEWRGELYPIALYVNGGYVDVTEDLTVAARNGFSEEALIQTHPSHTLFNAFKQFTVLGQDAVVGNFSVESPGVTQLACSTFLVGRGTFKGQQSLPDIFASLPEDRGGAAAGSLGDKKFDEVWKWTIAVHRHTPSTHSPGSIDEATVRQDLLTAGKPLMADALKDRNVTGEVVVEKVAVFDLNRDGKPEVLGTLRQGPDPKTLKPEAVQGQRGPTIAYANIWLSYGDNQPETIGSEVHPYEFPVTRMPYTVISTLDVTGDGIEEVIVRNNGYESWSFGIYELQNNQLKEVFNGGGYGC